MTTPEDHGVGDPWRDYHGHEALHVAHVLQNMVAHELEGHPFVTAHPDIAQQVELVQRELGRLYQAIGAIHLGVRVDAVAVRDLTRDAIKEKNDVR